MAEKQDNNMHGGQDNTGYYPPQPYVPPPYPGQGYSSAPFGAASNTQSHSTIVVQQPAHTTVVARGVPDNMGLAIFACLCCFWPLGLFAIFRANESQNALARGDIAGATQSGQDARKFSLISIAIGVVLLIVIIIVAIAVPVAAYNAAVTSSDYNSYNSYSYNSN